MNIRGLELSEEKTLITHIDSGFNFLGWNFRKYNGKMLIKPSKENIKKFIHEIRTIIKENQQSKQGTLIRALNPKIRGWCNYHQPVVSGKIFQYVDMKIYEYLWRWAKRRHTMKSRNWIMKKYWKTIGTRKWVFTDEKERLIQAKDTKIVRHISLKMKQNPYLPEGKEYHKNRKFKLGMRKLSGKFKIIWKNQKGLCFFCGMPLDIAENRDLHRLIQGKDGGKYTIENSRYTHNYCHKAYHANNDKQHLK